MNMGSVRDEGVGMSERKERRMADIEGWSMRSSEMQNDRARD